MENLLAEVEQLTEEQRMNGKQARSFVVKGIDTVSISAEECRKLCAKIGLKYYEGYERRILQYKFTDATTDRYSDRIIAKGVDLEKYRANPIVLAFHNSWDFPIGSTIKAWYDKETDSVKGWVLFYDANIDDSGFAESVFKFASSGAVKTGSIGFIPKKARRPTDEEKKEFGMQEWGVVYEEIELLEYSIVPLPANPSSMQEPISKGFFSRKTLEKLKEIKPFTDANETKDLEAMIDKALITMKGDNVEPEIETAPSVPGKKKSLLTINMGAIPEQAQLQNMLKQIQETEGVEATINIGVPSATVELKASPIINVEDLAELIHAKAGAVLSKKNKQIVKDAISALGTVNKAVDALQALLKAAGDDEEDEEDELDEDGKPKKGKEKSQKGSHNGDPAVGGSDPYGADFMGKLDAGIEALSQSA